MRLSPLNMADLGPRRPEAWMLTPPLMIMAGPPFAIL
jgi:hypothetical protein